MFSASKLNPYFKELYVDFDKEYTEEDPVKYLTQSRIDVIAKIIYCEYYLNITPTCFNRVFYYLHLKRWKGFKAKDTFKKNFLDYENEYQKIIDSINKIGFDMQESIIPVDIENKIIDGSHRLGATIVLRKRINVYKFLTNSPTVNLKRFIYDFKFNKNIGLIDYLIFNYIKYDQSLRIFTLFPRRNKELDKSCVGIIKKYGSIVITKSIKIGNLANGFHTFKNFYYGADWIGDLKNNYQGALWKTKACLEKTNGVIDVILFKPSEESFSNTKHLKKIKEEIRGIYNIHFHSIHSSDNHTETISYSKLFFHSLSQHLLQKRKKTFFNKLEIILETLIEEKIDSSKMVFSGSSVMAALGLREPKDIDIIHTDDFLLPENISSHNSQIKFFNKKRNELIFNPKYYFFYMGFKFLHPKIIMQMKIKRNFVKPNVKDEKDIEILYSFLNQFN